MRPLYFLVPGTGGRYACGGLFAEIKTLKLAQQICRAELVTYQQREANGLFLDDLLQRPESAQAIFVISWGFHVPKLAKRLQGHHVIYHAHSSGYGFRLSPEIPILTVSRNSMGYWGQRSPNALIYYLPNHVSEEFSDRHQPRDIDVLVQARKSSRYLMQQLVPALQPHCNLVLLDRYVEDLAGLFNRTRVYLYDSAEYWATSRVSEGFGLPPMEAMACGAQVFSSVNSALADYLDPGFNCYKIGCYATGYDVERILKAVRGETHRSLSATTLAEFRTDSILQRLAVILAEINEFCDRIDSYGADIPGLSPGRVLRLTLEGWWEKARKKVRG
ncbi:glycosyltransferase [filamentous cyanobacterium CCP5]|nr:glycosyltransferase [filamentous cyanobacterium CCP5]